MTIVIDEETGKRYRLPVGTVLYPLPPKREPFKCVDKLTEMYMPECSGSLRLIIRAAVEEAIEQAKELFEVKK